MVGEAALECALPFVMSMFVDTIGKVSSPEDAEKNINFVYWTKIEGGKQTDDGQSYFGTIET